MNQNVLKCIVLPKQIAMIRREGTSIVIGPYEAIEWSVLASLRAVAKKYGVKAKFNVFYV